MQWRLPWWELFPWHNTSSLKYSWRTSPIGNLVLQGVPQEAERREQSGVVWPVWWRKSRYVRLRHYCMLRIDLTPPPHVFFTHSCCLYPIFPTLCFSPLRHNIYWYGKLREFPILLLKKFLRAIFMRKPFFNSLLIKECSSVCTQHF